MPWRYQPVYTEDEHGRNYSICEVYFDDAGKFERWTTNSAIEPNGEDMESLTADITRMLVDAYAWEPVRYQDIGPGCVFRARISMDDRNNLAEYIEHTNGAFKRAPKPTPN